MKEGKGKDIGEIEGKSKGREEEGKEKENRRVAKERDGEEIEMTCWRGKGWER